MQDKAARDSLAAWDALRRKGGLELAGRDADFEFELRKRLSSSAATLDEALRASSTDDLVRALLALVHPFAEMFQAIIHFFKAAGAREGRDHWVVKIDEEHLDLEEFTSFLERWGKIDAEFECPALDFDGVWEWLRICGESTRFAGVERRSPGPKAGSDGRPDVEQWLAAYARGEYLAFPRSLHPARLPPGLSDAAAVAWMALALVRSTWRDRAALMANRSRGGERYRPEDALSRPVIAQNETDHWLRDSIRCLDEAMSLPPAEQARLGLSLQKAFARFDRRIVGVEADVQALERILSLPVWQRRHELYAVWIATEIVEALEGHELELHHDNGRITFAFRETIIATVSSTRPQKRLYSERRVPLTDPVGKDRFANVQPDYGIWAGEKGRDVCSLIVEVKHYKRASRARFSEVLVDYARAHPEAVIVLVNHGPASDMQAGVDQAIIGRCRVLGNLTAVDQEQRKAFRALVRQNVGEPVEEAGLDTAGPGTALLIDISGSMADALNRLSFSALFQSLVRNGVGVVALADARIRCRCSAADALSRIRAAPKGRTTALAEPLRALLQEFRRVLIVTDTDGLDSVDARIVDLAPAVDGLLLLAEVRREGTDSLKRR